MKSSLVFIIFLVLGVAIFSLENVQALTLGPPKFEFSADPGDVITDFINLRNETDSTETWYSSFETFTVRGESGEPFFSGKREGAATWIKTNPTRVTLGPGSRETTSFTINVPKDAEPGGHYIAIFWGTTPPETLGTGVGVASSMAVLVLLNVSGEAVESGDVLNFATNKKLFNYQPVEFVFNLKNTGTVHLKPQGEVVIKNIFGRTIEALAVNAIGYNVLPQTERNFTLSWPGKQTVEGKGFFTELKKEWANFSLGYYKAILNLEFGTKETKTTQSVISFWIFPWRILLFSILGLALLLFVLIQAIKRYNRWIINKARGLK